MLPEAHHFISLFKKHGFNVFDFPSILSYLSLFPLRLGVFSAQKVIPRDVTEMAFMRLEL